MTLCRRQSQSLGQILQSVHPCIPIPAIPKLGHIQSFDCSIRILSSQLIMPEKPLIFSFVSGVWQQLKEMGEAPEGASLYLPFII